MPLWWREQRPETLTVQAIHDGNEIAIQMVWEDSTHDHTALGGEDSRDVAAIQFPLSSEEPPFFGMGEAADGGQVNIWRWKANSTSDASTEDLVAQGFGVLEPRSSANHSLQATGVYEAGSYRLVFRRALKTPEDNAAILQPGTRYPVAFAVWDGSAGERGEKESVTIWQDLVIAP